MASIDDCVKGYWLTNLGTGQNGLHYCCRFQNLPRHCSINPNGDDDGEYHCENREFGNCALSMEYDLICPAYGDDGDDQSNRLRKVCKTTKQCKLYQSKTYIEFFSKKV